MGRKTVAERFWEKVNKTDGCWLWTAATTRKIEGYGRFVVDGRIANKVVICAHRWAWEQENGPVPSGLELDHQCPNTVCVRVSHLQAVTHKENMLLGLRNPAANHARKTHCPRGHPYDVVYPEGRKPRRGCNRCRREKHTPATPAQKRAKQVYDQQRRKTLKERNVAWRGSSSIVPDIPTSACHACPIS